jgi:hypothetical protein
MRMQSGRCKLGEAVVCGWQRAVATLAQIRQEGLLRRSDMMVCMLATLVPGLRHLRVPLAAGVVWMLIGWLLWARHLPERGQSTGLLAQVHDALAMVGPAVALTLFGFVAYLIGDIWVQARFPLSRVTRKVRRALKIPSIWRMDEWLLVDSFTTDNGMFRELLPNLGVRRPTAEDLTAETRERLRDAMYGDINRANIRLLGTDTELHEEFDRYWSEYMLKEVLAFPVSALVVIAAINASTDLVVVGISGVVGVSVWLALVRSAVARNIRAWGTVIEAIYLGRFPAPRMTEYGLEAFGPAEQTKFNRGVSGNDDAGVPNNHRRTRRTIVRRSPRHGQ